MKLDGKRFFPSFPKKKLIKNPKLIKRFSNFIINAGITSQIRNFIAKGVSMGKNFISPSDCKLISSMCLNMNNGGISLKLKVGIQWKEEIQTKLKPKQKKKKKSPKRKLQRTSQKTKMLMKWTIRRNKSSPIITCNKIFATKSWIWKWIFTRKTRKAKKIQRNCIKI